MRAIAFAAAGVLLFAQAGKAEQPVNGIYTATAYSQAGTTAAGLQTHRHIVAADPAILPAGSRIKIKHAGAIRESTSWQTLD